MNVKVITMILGRLGYRPEVVSNGRDAVEAKPVVAAQLIAMLQHCVPGSST